MHKAKLAANRFEAVTIFLLLAISLWPAMSFKAAVLVPMAHGLFLFGIFLLIRHYLARVRPLVAHLFFTACVSVLAIEIVVHHFTSLHLNRFVLSLAFQPQAKEQIGLSNTLFYLLAFVAGLAYLTARLMRWHVQLSVRVVWTVTFVALALSQGLYGFLLYQRDAGLLNSQRHLVFFTGLHHYYAEKIFTPIFGPRPPNPFAQAYDGTARPRAVSDTWEVTSPRNLLLIVIDSMRTMDMKADPTVAPNLLQLGQKGYLSLDHSSVANCTHFGMHTLFSGDLATTFRQARHSGKAQGIFAALSGAGYRLSSAEAQSLDWYDLAAAYLPGTARDIAPEGTNAARDDFVSRSTVARLQGDTSIPWAHLAYFSGPHFSYDENKNITTEVYREMIRKTDQRIARMVQGLAASGLLRDTLVIITSDHGEEVFENDTVGHGSTLNDAQTKVPLLVLGATMPTGWIRSHRDILPFVRAELGAAPLRALPNQLEVLTGCDYEFPKSFAVIDEDGRVDFRLQDGLLAPAPSPGSRQPSDDQIRRAGLRLIRLLNENK